MVKMHPPKMVPPPPGTSKDGLPLKNLDHLTHMKKRRPLTYFTYKIWTSGLLLRFLETIQVHKSSNTQCTS